MIWKTWELDADHCIATWDLVLLQVWHGPTDPAAVTRMGGFARAFVAESKQPISSLAVIEETAPPPSDLARQGLSRFYKEMAPRMASLLVVPEGSGFRSAFVRGVGMTLSALAPKSFPFKFIASVGEACLVLERHLSPSAGGATGLHQAVRSLRAEIAPTFGKNSPPK